MRSTQRLVASGLLALGIVHADIEPETVTQETLGEPGAHWIFAKSVFGAAYVFDAATGDMHGLVSLTPWTPAIQPFAARGEIYAAETYYSRQYHGDRNDVVTVYDMATLSPAAEIDVPDKITGLPFRQYIGLMDDERHLGVFNMTPAQSVSIVDVRDREFVTEVSTPGCALIMPVEDRGFLMLCGDGTLQLIRLDRDGRETERIRSESFFSVEDDPVYDKPVPSKDGWQLLSFEGKAIEVTVDGDDIEIGEPWSILTDEDVEGGWRVGGGQVLTLHHDLDLMFTLMHQGEVDTHEDPGTEIWVFDRGAERRIGRIVLEAPVTNILVDQAEAPLLMATTAEGHLQMFDVKTTRLVRTIEEAGSPALLQTF